MASKSKVEAIAAQSNTGMHLFFCVGYIFLILYAKSVVTTHTFFRVWTGNGNV